MEEVAYSVLLILSAAGVGFAATVGWLQRKLYQIDHNEARKNIGGVKAGIMITNGVLIERLIEAGTAQLSWALWAYSAGLVALTFFLAREARDCIEELAYIENAKELAEREARLVSMETRLTAEEARNTDIEAAARASMERADAAEERETQ